MAHDGCKLVSKTRLTLTGYGFDPCTFRQFLERQIPPGVWRSFRFGSLSSCQTVNLVPSQNVEAGWREVQVLGGPPSSTDRRRSKEYRVWACGQMVKSLRSGRRVSRFESGLAYHSDALVAKFGKRSTLRACGFGLWVRVPPRAPVTIIFTVQ